MSDPELLNASRDAEVVEACVQGGVEHDFRPYTEPYPALRPARTYLRCVWCKAVACGNFGEADPCIEVWHHEPKPHRTKSGQAWPIGGNREDGPA